MYTVREKEEGGEGMQIKKINDRQIRCVVTTEDLEAHQLTVKELRYGSTATSALFREVVAAASSQYGFNEEELPLMIEAVPIQNGELLLIISAVEDAEELDPHFAKYAEPVNADETSEEKEARFFETDNEKEGPGVCVFGLSDIEAVLAFAMRLSRFPGRADLYRQKAESGFYLALIRPESMEAKDFNVFLNTVSEYADMVPQPEALYAVLSEHEKPVMTDVVRKFGFD